MPEKTTARIVLTTVANLDDARSLGRALVEERLAACATLIPGIESVYRWKGELETSSEVQLLLKTSTAKLAALESRLLELHAYETPEFLVLPVETGSRQYLAWMYAGLEAPPEPN